ncbi:MAG: HEAT repeat domain-containing protein [Candidatus Melainabacteria bacterium]|nr:HEAT repeat domain-containing protein [Candidatus Melainabacteria bacterium]
MHILQEKSQPSHVRMDAILSLMVAPSAQLVAVLVDILSDRSEDPDVRSAVALTLGKLSSDEAFESLVAQAQSDNTTVRNYVLQALGNTGREEAVPILIRALQDPDNHVFASAADSLGRIGDSAIPYLMELLASGADDARCVAAWKLGEIQAEESVGALAKAVQADKNLDVAALSIWAIGEIGVASPSVMDVLQWARRQASPELHQRAAMAIKKIARHCN